MNTTVETTSAKSPQQPFESPVAEKIDKSINPKTTPSMKADNVKSINPTTTPSIKDASKVERDASPFNAQPLVRERIISREYLDIYEDIPGDSESGIDTENTDEVLEEGNNPDSEKIDDDEEGPSIVDSGEKVDLHVNQTSHETDAKSIDSRNVKSIDSSNVKSLDSTTGSTTGLFATTASHIPVENDISADQTTTAVIQQTHPNIFLETTSVKAQNITHGYLIPDGRVSPSTRSVPTSRGTTGTTPALIDRIAAVTHPPPAPKMDNHSTAQGVLLTIIALAVLVMISSIIGVLFVRKHRRRKRKRKEIDSLEEKEDIIFPKGDGPVYAMVDMSKKKKKKIQEIPKPEAEIEMMQLIPLHQENGGIHTSNDVYTPNDVYTSNSIYASPPDDPYSNINHIGDVQRTSPTRLSDLYQTLDCDVLVDNSPRTSNALVENDLYESTEMLNRQASNKSTGSKSQKGQLSKGHSSPGRNSISRSASYSSQGQPAKGHPPQGHSSKGQSPINRSPKHQPSPGLPPRDYPSKGHLSQSSKEGQPPQGHPPQNSREGHPQGQPPAYVQRGDLGEMRASKDLPPLPPCVGAHSENTSCPACDLSSNDSSDFDSDFDSNLDQPVYLSPSCHEHPAPGAPDWKPFHPYDPVYVPTSSAGDMDRRVDSTGYVSRKTIRPPAPRVYEEINYDPLKPPAIKPKMVMGATASGGRKPPPRMLPMTPRNSMGSSDTGAYGLTAIAAGLSATTSVVNVNGRLPNTPNIPLIQTTNQNAQPSVNQTHATSADSSMGGAALAQLSSESANRNLLPNMDVTRRTDIASRDSRTSSTVSSNRDDMYETVEFPDPDL